MNKVYIFLDFIKELRLGITKITFEIKTSVLVKNRFSRTHSQENKTDWKAMQAQVKASFEKDQDSFFNIQLKQLEQADSKHGHREV